MTSARKGRRTGSRLLAALAVALLAAIGVLGTGVATASAATDAGTDLLLSRDGVNYTKALDGALFDTLSTLTPGTSISASIWIKNPAPTASALRVSIRNLVASSSAFAADVTLTTEDSLSGVTSAPKNLDVVATCRVVAALSAVPAQTAVRVTVVIAMPLTSTNMTQSGDAAMDLLVSMQDASAGGFAPSACDDKGVLISAGTKKFTKIAYTGADVPLPLIIAGGVLVALGAVLVSARRRWDEETLPAKEVSESSSK